VKVLLWLMIPVAALIVGIIWAYVISRPAKPAAMQDSMESFSRFRHALASDPGSRAGRRAHHQGHEGESADGARVSELDRAPDSMDTADRAD
jgi:hypothetical protein